MDYRDGMVFAPLRVELGAASESQLYTNLVGEIVGVFVATFHRHPRDTPVRLDITFPTGDPIGAEGRVHFARVGEDASETLPGLGVRFTVIEPDDLERLQAFAAVRPPMMFDDET